MKKVLAALSLAFAATAAQADTVVNGLTLVGSNTPVAIVGSDGGWGPILSIPEAGYTSGLAGTLKANQSGWFVATYLGQVAAHNNFYLGTERMNGITNGGTIGSTMGMGVTAGSAINFSFGDDTSGGTPFSNGQTNQEYEGILYFANTFMLTDANGQLFDFLIGYNDTANVNDDYDDYVVGVINHVPVPAALPLMASALGLFGFSRRKTV